MSVSSHQKRKRSTADHSPGSETEDDETSKIKTRKTDLAVQLISVDASNSAESLVNSVTMTIDENILSLEKSTDEEVTDKLTEPQANGRQLIEPSSAHKKILQRQWTAEAHGHNRKVHSIQDEIIEIEEESIGTEILSVKYRQDDNISIDTNTSGHKKNGSRKAGLLMKSNDTTVDDVLLKKDVAKAVPKPRVSMQRSIDGSVAMRAIVTPLVDAGDHKGISKVALTSGSKSSATSLSNNIETIPPLFEERENEAIRDTPKLPKKSSSTKTIFLWVMILGFISILVALYLSLAVTPNKGSENQGGETTSSYERASEILLMPVVDDPAFSRSEQLLQQLDKLEQEASQLTDILNYAAAHEAEAQIQLEALRAEQTKLQIDGSGSIRNIEAAIAEHEEKISAITEAALSQVRETEELAVTVEAKSEEEKRALAHLNAIADKESRLESLLPSLETGILLAVPDTDNDSIADTDTGSIADADALQAAPAPAARDDLGVEAQNMEKVTVKEASIKKRKSGLSISEDDLGEEATATVIAAVSRVEDILLSLDRELSTSAIGIDRDVREHVSALASVAYVRYAEAAEAASASSAAAAIAAAASTSTAGHQSTFSDTLASRKTLAPAIPAVAYSPDHHLDYAVWPRGGRVVPPGGTTTFGGLGLMLTSPPYALTKGPLKRLRYKLRLDRDVESADETVLVSHSSAAVNPSTTQAEPVSCYAFAGSEGSVTVTMHSPVRVSAVQVLHSSKANDELRTNAPKKFRLIGWADSFPTSQSGVPGRDLGTFEYNVSRIAVDPLSELQSFPVEKDTVDFPVFKAITVSVLSNHGDPTHTSICRIKVLGELAK